MQYAKGSTKSNLLIGFGEELTLPVDLNLSEAFEKSECITIVVTISPAQNEVVAVSYINSNNVIYLVESFSQPIVLKFAKATSPAKLQISGQGKVKLFCYSL